MASRTLTITITLKLPTMGKKATKKSGQSVWPPFDPVAVGRFDPDSWTGLSPRERDEIKATASGPTRF
ncbi:MAG: hypothetical protein QGH54_09350 [SAR202 cluster bacterium]|nr:hypothetical protein [SAR202 cluster bacterium]